MATVVLPGSLGTTGAERASPEYRVRAAGSDAGRAGAATVGPSRRFGPLDTVPPEHPDRNLYGRTGSEPDGSHRDPGHRAGVADVHGTPTMRPVPTEVAITESKLRFTWTRRAAAAARH